MLHQFNKRILKAISILVLFTGIFLSHTAFSQETQDSQIQPSEEQKPADYFESIKNNPFELEIFMKNFPKGGDLHNHLSGAVYAESYIQWALQDDLCILVEIYYFTNCGQVKPKHAQYIHLPLSMVLKYYPDYLNRLIDGLSMRNFSEEFGTKASADQFFTSFDKYDEPGDRHIVESLAEVANRAASQNILYLELMITINRSAIMDLGKKAGWNNNFTEFEKELKNLKIEKQVEAASKEIDNLLKLMKSFMNCGTINEDHGCKVKVRILAQGLREFPKEQVFAQIMGYFQLAKDNSNVVGVNFVMREDGPTALKDYEIHMEILEYFKKKYSEVNLALHAGELTLTFVSNPDDVTFHIDQAVFVAQADRIGHGLDIASENRKTEILAEMKSKKIPVEINLTSNALILGVTGKRHPYAIYALNGVPIVLSTDDEGVLRTTLSREYMIAAQTFDLDYADLKHLSRNAIEYSFLPQDEKIKMLAELEKRFKDFETNFPRLPVN